MKGKRSKIRRSRRKNKISKKLKAYVKKAVQKQEETKTVAYTNYGNTLFKHSPSTWNVMYYTNPTQGTGVGQMIGDQFTLKGIRLKFSCQTTGTNEVYAEFALIKSRRFNTISSLTSSELFHNDITDLSFMDFDSSKVKVLWHKRLKIKPALSGGVTTYERVTGYKRLNTKVQFEDRPTGTSLKDYNYYLVAYGDAYTGVSGAAIPNTTYQIDECRLYYKDA